MILTPEILAALGGLADVSILLKAPARTRNLLQNAVLFTSTAGGTGE